MTRRVRDWACIVATLGALAAGSAPTRACADAEGDGLKTRFIIDDEDPESKVPSPREALGAPLQMGYWVMLVSDRAEQAVKRGDLAKAVKYYRALTKAAPDRAVGFTKICTTYEAMGDWQKAVASCSTAIEKDGVTIADYEHFVRLLLSKPQALSAQETAQADAVIAHLSAEVAKLPSEGPDAAAPDVIQSRKVMIERLRCEIGARVDDRKRLESCTRSLRKLAPQDPAVIAFSFALALIKPDFDEAERLIAGANRFGVNAAGTALMQRRLQLEMERRPLLQRVFGSQRLTELASACLVGLVLVGAAMAMLRRKLGLRTA